MSIKCFYRILTIILFINFITSSDYVNFDIENFDNELNASKEFWLIEFYSEKCSTCQEFASVWVKLTKQVKYLKIGRVNIDLPKGLNLATKINALDNGIPCIRLYYGKDKFDDIMIGTEEPFPKPAKLKERIDNILKKKGKLQNGKYFINEEL